MGSLVHSEEQMTHTYTPTHMHMLTLLYVSAPFLPPPFGEASEPSVPRAPIIHVLQGLNEYAVPLAVKGLEIL